MLAGGWNALLRTVPKGRTTLPASMPRDERSACTTRDQDCLAGLDDGTINVILKIPGFACADLGIAGNNVRVIRHRASNESRSLLFSVFIFTTIRISTTFAPNKEYACPGQRCYAYPSRTSTPAARSLSGSQLHASQEGCLTAGIWNPLKRLTSPSQPILSATHESAEVSLTCP